MAVSSSKGKKKRWVTIVAPKLLKESVIGDSYVFEPAQLLGKIIPINLMNITNDSKTQNVTMKFLITDIKDGKAMTRAVMYSLNQSFLKRMMRRKRNRFDESYHMKTGDGVTIRIKLFLLTNSKAKGSVEKLVRKKLKEETKKIVEKTKFEDLFDGIITHQIQKELRDKITKIFPLKTCEVKVLKEEKERLKTHAMEEEKKERNKREKKEEKKSKDEKDLETSQKEIKEEKKVTKKK